VHVAVAVRDGLLRGWIRDDGSGGADPAHGSGVLGFEDRGEGIGGGGSPREPPRGGGGAGGARPPRAAPAAGGPLRPPRPAGGPRGAAAAAGRSLRRLP